MALSEQEIVRRENLEKIRATGIEPYPAAGFKVSHLAADIHAAHTPVQPLGQVALAGRLMQKRVMGKASFAELQDSSGRIQVYINRDEICPDEDKTLY
ncbi:MAG: OB-fold nucleic acid binding domain-containing protein, partial [Saprospiraceae bacterium]|nr:OB-fold nucleic acid binding domain-containing protein [Saprospiraceae bacterium]